MMSDSLDAVVLAGGESRRLAGVVPPYHKPFLVVRGQSLLRYNVALALAAGAERVVVVTCPEIAVPTARLLEQIDVDPWHMHVVLRTGGPGLALRQGAELCQSERTLVLMADNWNRPEDVEKICEHRFAVGVREVSAHEANRFTRFERGRWREHGPLGHAAYDSSLTTIWCGPLLVSSALAASKLGLGDALIGPHLDDLVPSGELLIQVPVRSHDLGTPEALREFMDESSL